MKKQHLGLRNFFSLLAFLMLTTTVFAQAVETSAKAVWPFTLGTVGQTASFSEGTEGYFSQNYVTIGSNLAYKDFRASTIDGYTYTRFQPATQTGSASEIDLIRFHIRPKTGLTFTPDSIHLHCMRYGTDGGSVDVVWFSPDGTPTTIATAVKPNRDNNVAGGTIISVDLSTLNIPVTQGEVALGVYIYALGNTKQFGLSNVRVAGKLSGTIVNIPTHTVSVVVTPEGAGSVISDPVGAVFDEGTAIKLTANRNFGYSFSHWADSNDQSVSTENPYTFALNTDVALKAIYTQLNTYPLQLSVSGGGKDYMVNIAPAGTMVDGKRMYEEGVNVALTANNNTLMTFNNWGSGETNATLNVTMNEEKNVSAAYSAIDYIAGWDFWVAGGSGRVADFYSRSENETAALVLRKEDGTTSSWLDKSQVAALGYEGRPAAVNWKPLADKYYYQISFNAKDFKNLKVMSSMLFNYNAYSVQNIEYSIDGSNFTKLVSITMESAKVWYDNTTNLPADANHVEKVYIRWIPDYTSTVVGATSTNDGTAINGIYILADAEVFNDGIAPVLVSSVPENGATGASATGKVVLSFDEKIQITDGTKASLGTLSIDPVVSGQTISFNYIGLEYSKMYNFSLPANTVSDLSGNTLTEAISFQFTTMNKPLVSKKTFDFVIGKDGDFKAALLAASAVANAGNRFHIFIPKGSYDIGSLTGDANQMTTISIPNVSYIGEDPDSVILFNKSTQESINSTATIYLSSESDNVYMQDISLMNKMDYRTGTLIGRGVALWDKGNKNIFKNVKLLSNQDTYYTGSDRSYLENCEIHGTVDFICGGGDIFFNECLIYLEDRSGNVITAPASAGDWGYVFSNCTIDGFAVNNGGYRLGRPWSNAPKSVFINTTMKVLPTADAWGDPMNVVPAVFAEYNSMTGAGAQVDLSGRRTQYTKDANSVTLNPVLTAQQAATYTVDNVVGGTDNWQPRQHTEQVQAPLLTGNDTSIQWDNSDYVLCWAIYKNNNLVKFTTENAYVFPETDSKEDVYSIRAANEMGGLSAPSNSFSPKTVQTEALNFNNGKIVSQLYFTLDGKQIYTLENYKGFVIVQNIYENGTVSSRRFVRID